MAEISTLSSLFSDPNLKAYYRTSAGFLTADSSSGGFTLTNNNSVAEGTGKYGGGADFSNSNSNKSLSVANDFGIDGGAISVSFWVKLNAEIGSGGWTLFMHSADTSQVDTFVRYEYNSGTRRLLFSRNRPGTVFGTEIAYNITLGTSDWHHIVLTYNTTNLSGYVNNTSIGSAAASGNGSAATGPSFAFGASTYGSEYSSVIMDDIAVFNRLLSTEEVTRINSETIANQGAAFLLNFV